MNSTRGRLYVIYFRNKVVPRKGTILVKLCSKGYILLFKGKALESKSYVPLFYECPPPILRVFTLITLYPALDTT